MAAAGRSTPIVNNHEAPTLARTLNRFREFRNIANSSDYIVKTPLQNKGCGGCAAYLRRRKMSNAVTPMPTNVKVEGSGIIGPNMIGASVQVVPPPLLMAG